MSPHPLNNPGLPTFAYDQLPEDAVVFDGKVYRVPKSFDHPGGDVIEAHFQRDVSVHYRMMHAAHDQSGAMLVKHMELLGVLEKEEKNRLQHYEFDFESPLFTEIKAAVRKIVPAHKQWAPPIVWVHYFCVIVVYLVCRYYWIKTGGDVGQAIILGLITAHSYLTIFHACNHYQIGSPDFVKRLGLEDQLNRFLQILTGEIGYSSISWFCKHQEHHAYTQHEDLDPDMKMDPVLLRGKESCERNKDVSMFTQFQAIYLHFLGLGLWFQHGLGKFDPTGSNGFVLNDWIRDRAIWDQTFKLSCGVGLFVGPPIYTHGFFHGFLLSLLVAAISGSILVATFSPNHSFDDVATISGDSPTDGTKTCWAKLQIEGSGNFSGEFMAFLTGSLNYQVEHHLFPRMHAYWYPKIAPEIKRICKKHGVKYSHHPSLWSAWKDVLKFYSSWANYGKALTYGQAATAAGGM